MADRIAAVTQDNLTIDRDGTNETIVVGQAAWFDWLSTTLAFRYDCPSGHFTARKEPTSHGRGGSYWKAYRRSNGTLRRVYLGPTARLTSDRLIGAAAALADPRPVDRGPRSDPRSELLGAPAPPSSADATAVRPSARLRLLGTFELIDADGRDVPVASPRMQSLVAFLALHRDAPQSRRRISFLLWPDSSEAQARNNLRQTLHQLRHSWPDADRFLSADASALGFRPGVELVVDVDEYEDAHAAAVAADQDPEENGVRSAFERVARLYVGDLLPGAYDDWIAPARDRLISRHERMLDRLIGVLEEQGDHRAAIEYGQQRLRLDPLDERIYRWLMRLHALDQDRAGAILVYQHCASALERELGVEPDDATRELLGRILGQQTGVVDAPLPSSGVEPVHVAFGRPAEAPLIGRHREWAEAMTAWRRMTRGEAHLLVISGEPGIGKSRLAVELCEWAGQQGIKSARTRAYAAEGRLSFGPVADWLRSPAIAPTLSQLDTNALTEISRLLPELLAQRPGLPRPSARIEDWQRQPFFQALATAFHAAAQPILLVLDDLQWCDADTLEWLHFLLRSDRGARLLVAGTVRPEEVDRRHPLTRLLAELDDARQLSQVALGPLDRSETLKLAARVAGGPLSPEQSREIHDETEGNPLFVVETVRAGLSVTEAGDGSSRSVARAGAAATRRLPPKVQGVIATRLAQLSDPARDLAHVAATIGRAFTLDVVGAASGVEDDVLVDGLDELLRRGIVREQGGGRYDFAHDKIREVAYGEMADANRRLLHRRVADALLLVDAMALDGVAAQIAAHNANGGLPDRAAEYYQRAAEVAQRVGANEEAIGLLHRGLALLETLPPSPDRDTRELGLQTALSVSLVATEGYGAPEVGSACERSLHLCQVLGRPPSPPILRALALASLAKARIEECHALGQQLMRLAKDDDSPVLRVEAHYVLAMSTLLTGDLGPARRELEASLAEYDQARSAAHINLYSQDPAVVCLIRLGLGLWTMGDTDGSARRRGESLRLAEEIGHPFTMGYAVTWDAVLQNHRAEPELARARSEVAMALGREHRLPFWLSIATIVHGWAVGELGDAEAGIDEIRHGMASFKATGSLFMRPFQLGLLGEAYGRLGSFDRGLALIAEALALCDATNERWCEAELYRRQGDLLAGDRRDRAAETAYRRAVQIARRQGARSLQLRSATRLADSWIRRDRTDGVAGLLAPIVRSLGSATDLPELDRARTILGLVGVKPGPVERLTPR